MSYTETRKSYERLWRVNNPEKVKAQKTRYYEKKKEYLKQKSKDYYQNVRKKYLTEHADEERIRNKEKSQVKYAKRKALLFQLRNEMGGKCTDCNYDKEVRILNFHHLGDKVDNVTNLQSLEAIKAEAKKCILLCPNCHAIHHLTK